MIEQEFEIEDYINPAEEQHEPIQKKYYEENEEIELQEDDTMKSSIRIENNSGQVLKRYFPSFISYFFYQKYEQLKKLIQKIGFYTIFQLYFHLGYRRMSCTHPYIKDEFDNVLEYKKTLYNLYFQERHDDFADFFVPFNNFCNILEREEKKTEEKSKKLEEYRNEINEYIEKFHMN